MKTQLNFMLKCYFVVALVSLISGCQKEEPTDNENTLTGIYTLISVDGKPVPASISHDGATLQIRSGTFSFNVNGTCSSKMIFVPLGGTEVTQETIATYTLNGSKLTLQWKGAGTTIGTLEGNTFSMDNAGMLLVYSK